MSTSNTPVLAHAHIASGREPLRIRMAQDPGRSCLDGGWWPQSRDLTVELADLVDHFPSRLGRIVRAGISPPDWDPAPRRIPVRGGYVKAGSFPRDDTHVIVLTMSDRTTLSVLVVPPSFTRSQGEEALLASATAKNAYSATDLLVEVTDQPDTSSLQHWKDDGGSWWAPHQRAPSFRVDT